MKRHTVHTGIIIAVFATGCSDSSEPPAASTESQRPVEASPAPAVETSNLGFASFSVDGNPMRFGNASDLENTYTKFASFISARPSAGSAEMLSISFNSIDLRKIEFPADLPLPKDFSKPIDPFSIGATVSFIYVDGNGDEWAGPGNAWVGSYDSNGVLTGSFDGLSISHVDEALPNVTLSDGQFQVQISRPW